MKSRMFYIDIIKGFAIFLIVLGHMNLGLMDIGMSSDYSQFLDLLVYSIHLPILFITSGYLEKKSLSEKKKKIPLMKYIKKTMITLYIPYLIFIYFFWFIKMYIYKDDVVFSDVFYLPISGKWVFWFCLSLILVKISNMILQKAIKKDYIIFAIWLIPYILSFVFDYKLIIWLSYGTFYSYGYLLINLDFDNKKIKNVLFFALVVGLTSLLFNNFRVSMIFIGIPFTTLMMLLLKKSNKFVFLQKCGEYSMVIFLLHTIFTSVFRIVMIKLGIHIYEFLLLGGTILSIALSLFVVLLYKKIKILNFIEFFFYPNKKLKIFK